MTESFPRIEFYQARDGARLAARVWQPSIPPIAQLVLLHGIISHSGWYARSCADWAAAGIAVHFLDRRGSGMNIATRGDVDTWITWLDDVDAYIDQLGETPTRLLGGISWGGKLAVAVARRHAAKIAGLALICPGIHAYQQPGPLKRLALASARLPLIGDRRVNIPLADPTLFTNSPVDRDYIRDDPLTLRQVTLRFARHDQELTRFARQAPRHIHMPILLVLAAQDGIVANTRMRSYMDSVSSLHKTVQEYSNASHTLEFEPDPTPYFRDVADWVRKVAHGANV